MATTGTGPGVQPPEFRAVMAQLASGVTVIMVSDPATGQPRGMTASAVMSVSLAPPLVVVSVRRQAHLHDALARAGAYSVTVLGEHQEAQACRFAGLPAGERDEPPAFREADGVPVLSGGLAWLVARITAAHPAGDHTLFVGKVTGLGADQPRDPPLAFHRSAFARLAPLPPPAASVLHAWENIRDMWG
jgi:flavin reductase (DIM6/NTAB) family NADH-FMN oxidoreductase RutF